MNWKKMMNSSKIWKLYEAEVVVGEVADELMDQCNKILKEAEAVDE